MTASLGPLALQKGAVRQRTVCRMMMRMVAYNSVIRKWIQRKGARALASKRAGGDESHDRFSLRGHGIVLVATPRHETRQATSVELYQEFYTHWHHTLSFPQPPDSRGAYMKEMIDLLFLDIQQKPVGGSLLHETWCVICNVVG
jgi:hypothetical protein